MLNEDEKSDKKSEVCILRPSKHQTPEIDTTKLSKMPWSVLFDKKKKYKLTLIIILCQKITISLPLNILTPVC